MENNKHSLLRRVVRKLHRGRKKSDRPRVGQILDIKADDLEIINTVRPYTITSELRIEALLQSVRYCIERDIPGSFVECGVWRGGSVMAMILQLMKYGITDRDIYLYDTFEGMTEPTEEDISEFEAPAIETWQNSKVNGKVPWSQLFSENLFNENLVREVLLSTGYPESKLHFVRGPVEETIPDFVPKDIALLRLDTDWYESTRHELQHLYPRMPKGGVLIIDDYGHWEGARKAVDEYFSTVAAPLLLNRIDYSGRLAIKL